MTKNNELKLFAGEEQVIAIKNVLTIDYQPYKEEFGYILYTKEYNDLTVYTREINYTFNIPITKIILIEVQDE